MNATHWPDSPYEALRSKLKPDQLIRFDAAFRKIMFDKLAQLAFDGDFKDAELVLEALNLLEIKAYAKELKLKDE